MVNFNLPPDFRAWVDQVIGKRLQNVLYELWIGTDNLVKSSHNPITIEMRFEGAPVATFNGHSDGASLIWKLNDLEPSDMGSDGYTILKSYFGVAPWKGLSNNRLGSVQRVFSDFDRTDVGLVFTFEDQSSVSILNLGNELYSCAKIPPGTIKSEQLSFFDLT